MKCLSLQDMFTLATLLLFMTLIVGLPGAFAHRETDAAAATRSSRDRSVSVCEQLQIHSSSHQVYPLDADLAGSKIKFALETETPTAAAAAAAAAQTTRSDKNDDDGTVSSANSNRTPDYSFQANAHVHVELFCTIDTAFCDKVAGALIDAANDFSQVINIKNDLV